MQVWGPKETAEQQGSSILHREHSQHSGWGGLCRPGNRAPGQQSSSEPSLRCGTPEPRPLRQGGSEQPGQPHLLLLVLTFAVFPNKAVTRCLCFGLVIK